MVKLLSWGRCCGRGSLKRPPGQNVRALFPRNPKTDSPARGVFTCDAGDMPLSRDMHAILTKRLPTHRPRAAGVEVGRRLTRWFCPGCGVPLGAEMICT